jgi:ATP-dependent exoDNAse (exonuclease V) alpha subunit
LVSERTIIDTGSRGFDRGTGVLDRNQLRCRADLELNSEQLAAVRAITSDGRGVSVLQALAGTGKTRVLAALASAYTDAGYRVIGVAPTGRASRELSDAAGIQASTIHRLVSELEEGGGLAARTVVLFDEAGTAPTRPSAGLFVHADRAGAKIIATGDSGQLPSVAAGGWFAAVAGMLNGAELRQVMRQRDPAERDALDALRDGDPEPYLELKVDQGALTVHEHEREALARAVADWDAARQAHGVGEEVMIARDNATRELLNRCARDLLSRDGTLGDEGVTIGSRQFRLGDRVIARRNDRHHDVDNGTLGRVTSLDQWTRAVTITTNTGDQRTLPANYVAGHVEPAYALTAHGAQGATFEWAGVLGRPSEFTREWAYTAVSRARESTRLYVIAEAAETRREREHYAPPEPARTATESREILARSMMRRESEELALEQSAETSTIDATTVPTPAVRQPGVPPVEPNWRALRDERSPARGITR